MKNVFVLGPFLVLLWIFPGLAVGGSLADDVGMPPGSKLTTIGQQMRINGIATEAGVFASSERVDALRGFFIKSLGAGNYREQPFGNGGLVMSWLGGGQMLTIQLKALSGKTRGIVSRTPLVQLKGYQLDRPWFLPSDAKVGVDVESNDDSKISRYVSMTTGADVERATVEMTARLKQKGFSVEREGKTTQSGLPARTLWLRNDSSEAMVVVQRQNDATHMVVNIVRQMNALGDTKIKSMH